MNHEHAEYVARNSCIVADRRDGMTYTAMAAKYGLTRERCRQICKAAGMPKKNVNFPTKMARRKHSED